MKVLQVNCVYNNGSTGKIVFDIHVELKKQDIESVVCYGRGTTVVEPNVYKTCSELYSKFNNLIARFTGLMYGGCHFSTNRLISIIKKEKPDIVHLHCINGCFVNVYRLVTWLKEHNIKTVLTLHAEFMYTGNCGHAMDCDKWKSGCGNCSRLRKETKSLLFDRTHTSWKKMKNAFDGFDNLIVASVSPWQMERAKQSSIFTDKHHCVVFNGVDTNIFHSYDTSELKKKHNITNEKIIFHATAGFSIDPNHIKGGYYVFELAKRLIKENVKIFVAGTYDTSIVPAENVVFLGRIDNQKMLAQYYSMADLTLLTSKKETFSMPVAESLCCGIPVVGFKAGGPESIAIPEYSKFVEYGDLEAITSAVHEQLNTEINKLIVPYEAANIYSREIMSCMFIQKYKELIIGDK